MPHDCCPCVERLRGERQSIVDECRKEGEALDASITTLREHLETNHDIAVASFSRAGVRHDKETCATCKLLAPTEAPQ